MKAEMADRRLRVRSENSARISAKDLFFAFVGIKQIWLLVEHFENKL